MYKISIGSNIVKGPWGGGNQFAISLIEYLKNKGWKITNNLKEKNLDFILLTEPRITSKTSSFNQRQIANYVFHNPYTIVFHRINECDERKGTKSVNKYLMRANQVADYTIFISKFLMELFEKQGFMVNKKYGFIRNGADASVFNRENKKKWDKKTPLKVVTHHWGYSYNKGFDIYLYLDKLKKINDIDFKFTYIGRIPSDLKLTNMNVIPPLSGRALADELKNHDIYLTASINEPAGMHHIEGAMCGLPLLYRDSGALPEYCNGYGVMFKDVLDFNDKFMELVSNYDYYYDKMPNYPYNSKFMAQNYEETFIEELKSKKNFNIGKRRVKYLKIFLKESILWVFDIMGLKLRNLYKKIKRVG